MNSEAATKAALWMLLASPTPLLAPLAYPSQAVAMVGFAMMLALCVAALATHFLSLTRITVGRDGAHIKRRSVATVVPFSRLARVLEVGDGAVLRLIEHSGAYVDVYTGKGRPGGRKPAYVERCDQLVSAIQVGIDEAGPPCAEDALARQRLVRRAAVMLRTGASSDRSPYREVAAPSSDELWRILENAHATTAERAAAAALLLRGKGEETLARLERTRDRVDEPSLKRFLRIATDDEEPALTEALAELEAGAAEPSVIGGMRVRR